MASNRRKANQANLVSVARINAAQNRKNGHLPLTKELDNGSVGFVDFTKEEANAFSEAFGAKTIYSFSESGGYLYGPDGETLITYPSSAFRFSYTGEKQLAGFVVEDNNRNGVNRSSTFATSSGFPVWTQTNMTGGGTVNATGPDGTTSAVTLTATAANATIRINPITATGNRIFAVWLRRVSGTGDIQLSLNNSTFTTVSVTSEWQRFKITAPSTQSTPTIRITTSGDVIEAWGPWVTGTINGTTTVHPLSTSIGVDSSCGHSGTKFWIEPAIDGPLVNADSFTAIFQVKATARETINQRVAQFILYFEAKGGDCLADFGYFGDYGEGYFEDISSGIVGGPIAELDDSEIIYVVLAVANNQFKLYLNNMSLININDVDFEYNLSTDNCYLELAAARRGLVYLQKVALWPYVLSDNEINAFITRP
jgi:hypothetical protein